MLDDLPTLGFLLDRSETSSLHIGALPEAFIFKTSDNTTLSSSDDSKSIAMVSIDLESEIRTLGLFYEKNYQTWKNNSEYQ